MQGDNIITLRLSADESIDFAVFLPSTAPQLRLTPGCC
jgi:hypothetical protein